MSNVIWISWENHRRNKGISSALGCQLYEIVYEKPRLLRYILSVKETICLIYTTRPKIVIAQNPSVILAFLVLTAKYVFKYIAVIDAHNAGLYPFEGRLGLFMCLSRRIIRYSDLTIVTNSKLKYFVESNGGRAFVLPDRLPNVPETIKERLEGDVSIVFICTFGKDEPYEEVFKAASLLEDKVIIYVTGKYDGKVNERKIPLNVRLMGFICDHDYWALLKSSDIILDLTLRENCLVCGAYEAVALKKPTILSDTEALRSYFNKGCVYVPPEANAIAKGIELCIREYESLVVDVTGLNNYLDRSWNIRIDDFKNTLSSISFKADSYQRGQEQKNHT